MLFVLCSLFSKSTFSKNYFRNTIRVANRTSGLIWIQNVCKSYHQMIKVAASRQIVNSLFLHYVIHTIRAINVLQFYVVYFHSILASVIVICEINLHKCWSGAQWLSGRVLDSRPKGRGFEPHRRHCVVVLEQDTFILA